MKKIIFQTLLIVLLTQFVACSNDESSINLFSPPETIHGIWIDRNIDGEDDLIRLTINSNNIIEENYNGLLYPDEYINFNQKFDSDQYNINETITPTTYEVIIERKDGQFIQEEYGITTFRRKYIKSFINTVDNEALLLDYSGTLNMYLKRE